MPKVIRNERTGLCEVDECQAAFERFDPNESVIDYLIWSTVDYALKNKFAPPFRLRIAAGDETVFRESILLLKKGELSEQVTSGTGGEFRFPLTCSLTDKRSKEHQVVISQQQMEGWINACIGISKHVRLPAAWPDYSAEAFEAVHEMIAIATINGLVPPFTAEVRDANGTLFDSAEIWLDKEDEFRGNTGICDCAHLKFPLTIRLTSEAGELTTVVQRRC